jgi:branched-chain amino acid aminotransferase
MTTTTTEPTMTEIKDTSADLPLVYVNGEMLPKSQASVNVFDHGLLYGDGIFEGIRIYRGKIFKAQRHMDRLWGCAEKIRLEIPISREELLAVERQCVKANKIVDGYIRLVITRGVGNLGLNPFLCPKASIICIADQIRLFPAELYETGMNVIVASRPRVPVECLDPRIKSLNYLNNIMAKVEAIDQGMLEVVMLNTDGYVAEGSGDNIFFVKDGVVVTPPPEAGILEGITRAFVLEELCPKLGLKSEQRLFRLDELLDADEVFLTGSAAEIIAVRQIDETVITEGEGPTTNRLRSLFREIVTSDNVPED